VTAVPGTGRQGLRRNLHPDIRPLVAQAEAQGWKVHVAGTGHLKLKDKGGRSIILPSTPSDHRASLNARAHIRREIGEPKPRRLTIRFSEERHVILTRASRQLGVTPDELIGRLLDRIGATPA
jgi:hypothetical protein